MNKQETIEKLGIMMNQLWEMKDVIDTLGNNRFANVYNEIAILRSQLKGE